jgi:hypothetical protein
MLDTDTFLTILYVLADDFCKLRLEPERHPGPQAALSRSEVITLALFSQWEHFRSELDFYAYARRHLRPLFPTLPDATQFNRSVRKQRPALEQFTCYLASSLQGRDDFMEALDTTAVPTRDCKRRGRGWLAGLTNIGWSNRLHWYEGFRLLLAVSRQGVITGFGFAPASTNDRAMAETLLALRSQPHPPLLSVGASVGGVYLADKGFRGRELISHWSVAYGAQVYSPPERNHKHPWPKTLRRLVASLRQIVETINDKLLYTFRLATERPHDLEGFRARLSAKVAFHNFLCWLNQQYRRPLLAFADLIDW